MTETPTGGGYRILSVLGQGGFGTVYRARYEGSGGFSKEVAIKVLNPDMGGVEEMARRLRDEARLLGLLRHPAIVTADRLARLEGRWAVVMELIDGLDLQQLGEATELPLGVVLEIGAQVAGALHAAWHTPGPAGEPLEVLHRDIKPGNVLLTAYGEVKILDFGVARAELDSREAETGRFILGSPQYMAPERLDGEEGPAGDVYSLGVMLLQALTGDTLGRTTPVPREHAKRLEARLQPLRVGLDGDLQLVAELLAVLMAHEPQDRPTALDCQEALRALAEAAGGPSIRRWAMTTVPPLLAEARVAAAAAAQEAGILDTVLVDEGEAPPPSGDQAGEEIEPGPPPVHTAEPPRALSPAPEREAPSEPVEVGALADLVSDEPPQPSRRSGAVAANRTAALAAARRDDLFEQPPTAGDKVPWRVIGLAIGLGAALGVVGMLFLGDEEAPQAEPQAVQMLAAPGAEVEPEEPQAEEELPSGTRRRGPASSEPDQALRVQPPHPKVLVTGDADEVYLVSATGTYAIPGPVPADTYTVEAVFPNRERVAAGTVTVQAEVPLTVHCSASMLGCKAR